jgi:DNA-binding LacI/PurR family transcriptional regulator
MVVRIKDIAEKANVSMATVSLVINGKPGIGEETREKVLRIAKELNYRIPDLSYREQTGKGTIRFLKIAKHGHTVNRDHEVFIADYTDGLSRESTINGYGLEINTFKTGDIAELVNGIKNLGQKAIIALGTELDFEDIEHFSRLKIPVVFIDTYFDFFNYDFIDMNNIDAVSKIIQHFVEYGHREIGFLRSPVKVRNFQLREIGYKNALRYFQIPYNEKYVFSVDSTIDGAYSDMLQILKKGVKPPQALFSTNDIIAYGCIKALKERGFSIPGDISIIGFDDLPLSAVMDPPLSTLKVSKTRIGKIAMKHAIIRIEEISRMPAEKVLVGGMLICRKSVKNLKQQD